MAASRQVSALEGADSGSVEDAARRRLRQFLNGNFAPSQASLVISSRPV